MLLCELFSDDSGSMMTDIRQQIMDYLTPLVSNDVEFVTVQDVEATLRNYRTGLVVDRGLIMQVLDPNKIKLVKKIEGDKIYLSVPAAMTSASTPDDQAKAEEKFHDKAQGQALKNIKK